MKNNREATWKKGVKRKEGDWSRDNVTGFLVIFIIIIMDTYRSVWLYFEI